MPPSTLPTSPPPELAEAYGLEALARFYRRYAWIYDGTRPFFLLGRGEAVAALGGGPGQLVLDVGCGTGWSLPRLAATGAQVIGVDCSPAMRERARARLARLDLAKGVGVDSRAYGSHDEFRGRADRALLSYSLSMIPPLETVLESLQRDLRPGGRLVVVDFLDALPPVAGWLRASHVFLGPARLEALRRAFPVHRVEVRRAPLWRYYLFRAEAPAAAPCPGSCAFSPRPRAPGEASAGRGA